MSTTTKKIIATRDFTDAGLEKQFAKGDDVSSEPGVANYVAAGFAAEPDADKVDAPANKGGKPA